MTTNPPAPPADIIATAVAHAVAPIIAIDGDHIIRHASPAAQELLGTPTQHLVGRSLHDLVPEAFRATHRSHVEAFVASPNNRAMLTANRIFSGLSLDGRGLKLRIQLGPPLPGTGRGAIAAIEDFTQILDDRAKLASAEQARVAAETRAAEAEREARTAKDMAEAANSRAEAKDKASVIRVAQLGVVLVVCLGAAMAVFNVGAEAADLFRKVALFGMTTLANLAAGYAIGQASINKKPGGQQG